MNKILYNGSGSAVCPCLEHGHFVENKSPINNINSYFLWFATIKICSRDHEIQERRKMNSFFFFERRPLKVKSEMNLKNKQKIHWENEGRVGMEEHLSSAVGAQRKMCRNETAWGVLWLVICTAWEKFYCVELLMFASSTDLMVMVKLRRKWSSRIYSAQETCSSRVRRELL